MPQPNNAAGRVWPWILLLGAAPSLTAQEVRGRVVAEADTTPILQALLLLVDDRGHELARTTPTPSGGFELRAARSGGFRIRVQRIGHRVWESSPLQLSAGEIRRLTLRVPDTPFQLADLQVLSRRPRCGVTLGDGSVGARVLQAAQTALGLAEAEAESGRRTYAAHNYRRTVAERRLTTDSSLTGIQLTGWPMESADPDSLRLKGFVQGQWPNPSVSTGAPIVGPTYFAPDARVLFSDWFLETHCIALDTVAAGGDPPGAMVARFEPARGTRKAASLTGRLVFDRKTLGLRLLNFEFVARPRWAPPGSAGGELRFARLPDGAWVPARWELRVPLPTVGFDRYRFYGRLEVGGQVTSVRRGGRADLAAQAAIAEALQ